MNKQFIFYVIALFLMQFTIQAYGQDRCTIGEVKNCEVQSWFQYWTVEGCSNPDNWTRLITGYIKKNKLNVGPGGIMNCRFYDADWNIHIDPDSDFEGVVYNHGGEINPENEDENLERGWIEAEFKVGHPISSLENGLDVRDLFPVGTPVEAMGYFVEDHGHGEKTELHPLIYIKSLTDDTSRGIHSSANFTIFATQDASGRFDVANNDLDLFFPIPMPTQLETEYLYISTQNSNIPVHMLSEDAIVDQITWDGYTIPREWLSNVTAHQVPGEVEISAHLPGLRGTITPIYRGVFNRSSSSLLDEKITIGQRTESGKKIVTYNIELTLQSPPQGQLAFSEWIYEQQSGTGAVSEASHTENTLSGTHTFTFFFEYAPWKNLNKGIYNLHIMGSTRDPSWTPGLGSDPEDFSVGGEVNRTFLQANRQYKIPTSQLSLEIADEIRSSTTSSNCPSVKDSEKLGCLQGWSFRRRFHSAHGADLENGLHWYVQLIKNANGQEVDESWQEVTQANPLNANDFSARISDNNPDILEVMITRNEKSESYKLPVGSSFTISKWNFVTPGSNAEVRVIATGTSDMGEYLQEEMTTSPLPACFRDQGLADCDLSKFFEDIIKGLQAVNYLKEIGVLSDPWQPEGPEPPGPVLEKLVLPSGELYEWIPEMEKTDRTVLNSLNELMKGERISDAEFRNLIKAAEYGSKIKRAIPKQIAPHPKFDKLQKASTQIPTRSLSSPPKYDLFDRLMEIKKIRVPGVKFSHGKFNLNSEAKESLDNWIKVLNKNPQLSIQIAVITEGEGTVEYNKHIAQMRASAIKNHLLNAGINTKRLEAIGYGGRDLGAIKKQKMEEKIGTQIEIRVLQSKPRATKK